jgi:VIT1/CCC1 family predicted Fe2+/Mn2+ transporter
VIRFGGEKERLSKGTLKSKSAFSSRLAMALFGGIALIVPTVIMTLYQDVKTCLIVTAVATVIFAFIFALGARDGTGKDVLGATAAYTAVLVVFLGSSVGGNN